MDNPSYTILNPLRSCIFSVYLFQKVYWRVQVSGCLLIVLRGFGFHCLMAGDQLHCDEVVLQQAKKSHFVFLAP